MTTEKTHNVKHETKKLIAKERKLFINKMTIGNNRTNRSVTVSPTDLVLSEI